MTDAPTAVAPRIDVPQLVRRCRRALADGFAALDRPSVERGFWDAQNSTYVRTLDGVRGERGIEPPDDRYTPFGLAGAIEAHRLGGGGDAARLRAAARWTAARTRGNGFSVDNFFYGGLWALAADYVAFGGAEAETAAVDAFRARRAAFLASSDLNYGAGLWGLSQLVPKVDAPDLTAALTAKAEALAAAVNERGIPATGDRRAAYHQRMMYCTWGLCGAARTLGRADLLAAARRILDFVVAERYDDDGGLRWHALREPRVMPGGGARIYPYGKHLYYECHQCFFILAVDLYMEASSRRDFVDERDRAAQWIFGGNRWSLQLTELGPPGLPARCATSSGRIGPVRNRFKGCYEVGAYLWAMARLVANR